MKVLQDILEITKNAFPTPEIQEIEDLVKAALSGKTPKIDNSLFEEFWKAYPPRKGNNPKQDAKKKFDEACKEVSPDVIIRAAKNFCCQVEAGTPFVPQARTWLNQKCYLDEPKKEIVKPPKNLMSFNGDMKAYLKYLKEFDGSL